jgi:Zn-finger nucleic acid-binding protein
MKCPACSSTLTERTAGALTADICEAGCGGIYLDRFELGQVDETTEVEGEALLEWSAPERPRRPDLDKRFSCPRCQMIMMRHQFKPDIPVMVDTCPKCAGIWLDRGELQSIRSAEGTDAERVARAQQFIWQAFADIKKDNR